MKKVYSTLFCLISTAANSIFASRNINLSICGGNLEILKLSDYGRIFAGNFTKTTSSCKFELLSCQNCLLELSWRVAKSNFLINSDDKCDFGSSPNTIVTAEISVLEEMPSDEFYPKCRKYSIFFENATKKNMDSKEEVEIYKNFTSSINKLILIMFSTLEEKSIHFPIIDFRVIENTVIRRGRAFYDQNSKSTNSTGFITSPWYPKCYPQNIIVNYTLINENSLGRVQLFFTDYQLHYMSSMKILDTNGSLIHGITSTSDYSVMRHCAVRSSGPKLTLLFSSGPYTMDIGFRAEYKFTVHSHWPEKPMCKTCDKIYDGKGGLIMLDPSIVDTPNIHIDCIWLVSKSRFSSPLYDQIYLKIRDLSLLMRSQENLSFEIRAGLTSQSPILFHLATSSIITNEPDSTTGTPFPNANDSFIVNLPDGRIPGYEKRGFYIRLTGYYKGGMGVALIFTQFYNWANAVCHDAREYHCANGRCIAGNLQCDENDHCGDHSDESQDLCLNTKETSSDILLQHRYIKKYLVESESSPAINAGGAYATTVILISCVIGLIVVLVIVTVVAAKIYRQRLATLQCQLNAPVVDENSRDFNAAGPSIHQMGQRRLFVWPAAATNAVTRVFEAPPTYDDALKHPTVPPDGVINEAFTAAEESEAASPVEDTATTITALPLMQMSSESGSDSGTVGTLV